MKSKYFKVRVIKHTPLLFNTEYVDTWLSDKVGRILLVKEVDWPSAFYETKIENGVSVLKSDCERIAK